jgi:hypothetical protein
MPTGEKRVYHRSDQQPICNPLMNIHQKMAYVFVVLIEGRNPKEIKHIDPSVPNRNNATQKNRCHENIQKNVCVFGQAIPNALAEWWQFGGACLPPKNSIHQQKPKNHTKGDV